MKLCIPLICILIVVLGCSFAPQQRLTVNKYAISVNAPDLLAAYKRNEIEADNLYKGRVIKLEGTVDHVSDVIGTAYVHLKTGDDLMTVDCAVSDFDRQKVAELRKGQHVQMVGLGDGLTANLYVGLRSCEIR
jgi:hypothetical protein